MSWRPARSLETLREQVDRHWPNRNKASDGMVASAQHHAQNPTSDHEPNAAGVVCAFDITQDPKHGADMAKLAEGLRKSKDPRIAYVIWDHRIFSSSVSPWSWRPYSGVDPHTNHLHLSVQQKARLYDDPAPWMVFDEEDDMPLTDADLKKIAEAVWSFKAPEADANGDHWSMRVLLQRCKVLLTEFNEKRKG